MIKFLLCNHDYINIISSSIELSLHSFPILFQASLQPMNCLVFTQPHLRRTLLDQMLVVRDKDHSSLYTVCVCVCTSVHMTLCMH